MPKLVNVDQIDKNSVEQAFDINNRTSKVVTFVFPVVGNGTFGPMIDFAYNGKIKSIEAQCSTPNDLDTIFYVESTDKQSVIDNNNEISAFVPNDEIMDDELNQKCLIDFPISLVVSPWKKIIKGTINKNSMFLDNSEIITSNITKDTLLRINFVQGSVDNKFIEGLTIQITIETNPNY